MKRILPAYCLAMALSFSQSSVLGAEEVRSHAMQLGASISPTLEQPLNEGMTLADFERIAEQNNPTLAQAAARVRAAQAEWLQAGLYPNPRVGYHATEIGDEKQAGQQGAFASQEFVTAGKLRRGRDVAAQAVREAEFACQAQRQRVIHDVRRAFYDVLVAQRTIELTDQLVRIEQESERASEQLFNAKEVSRVDVLQAKIEAETARLLAEKARNRYAAAWRNLAAVTGAGDMQPTPLAGELHDCLTRFTWEESLARVLDENPELAEARAGIARAEAVVCREIAMRIPNVDLLAGAAYDNATRDSIAEVQVGVPLPLFNRNQGNIRKAQAEASVARAEARRIALELQQKLAATFEQYQNAYSQVERYSQEILPNAQTSLDLVTAGYRREEFSYVTLLMAQRTFVQVNLAYVEAIRNLHGAVAAIENHLLSDSLQRR